MKRTIHTGTLSFTLLLLTILFSQCSTNEPTNNDDEGGYAHDWTVEVRIFNDATDEGIVGVRVRLWYEDLILSRDWRSYRATDLKTTDQNGKCKFHFETMMDLAIKRVRVLDSFGNVIYEDERTSSPAIGSDGIVYVGTFFGKLHAIKSDGTTKWVFQTGDIIDSSPIIDGGGTIYVGSHTKKLYAISHTGQLKWEFATNDWIRSSPAIGSTGTIYVSSYDKTLYAFSSVDKPDLVVSQLKIRSITSTYIQYLYTITNIGTVPANLDGPTTENYDNVDVQAFLSADTVFNNEGDIAAGGRILGLSPLGDLLPGESFSGLYGVGGKVDTLATPYITLMVDWGEVVDESNEQNNTTAVRISSGVTSVDKHIKAPMGFSLNQNYPNPFNPRTMIRFELPQSEHVVIRIFNTMGQEIRILANTGYPVGHHSIRWDGNDYNGNQVSSGIYLYQLQAGEFNQVKKMSLIG